MIYIAVLSNREMMGSLQNRFYNTPLVHWTHAWQPHNWRISTKALAKYQIILLGEQRHIGVNNLPKVVARQCISRESNPRPFERKSNALSTTPPSHRKVLTFNHQSAWSVRHAVHVPCRTLVFSRVFQVHLVNHQWTAITFYQQLKVLRVFHRLVVVEPRNLPTNSTKILPII